MWAPIPGAQSIRVGPDGHTYVVAEKINQVVRIVDDSPVPFVYDDPDTDADELFGLRNPTSAVFGRDGSLYVAGFASDDIHRFDGTTGQHLGKFADASQGIDGPDAGMDFGPDGLLYVPCFEGNRIVVLDSRGVAVQSFDEGLETPRTILFVDGELWVSVWRPGKILRLDHTGQTLAAIAEVPGAAGALFDGRHVWASSDQANVAGRFVVETGELVEIIGRDMGIEGATFLAWDVAEPRSNRDLAR